MQVKDREVLVVGFARSGLAAANFLLECGAKVTITDTRSTDQLKNQISRLIGPVRLSLGEHRIEDFLNSELIILSPGVPTNRPELRKASRLNIPIVSEVELAYQFLLGTIVGVTGSNGKTTTTTLIGKLFKNAGRDCVVAGNIGSPLVQWVRHGSSGGKIQRNFVVELSSFQLETIKKFRCQIAAVLNITPDHQDRYKQFEDYIHAKERILLNQTPQDHAVLNADDPYTLKMSKRCRSSVVLFSRKQQLEQGIFVQDGLIRIRGHGRPSKLMPVEKIGLRGKHNLENILAAAGVGIVAGLDNRTLAHTFESFTGVEHRLEMVTELKNVSFYNDSKATNIISVSRAIEAFSEPLILIMGGLDKGADFRTLRQRVKGKIKLLVLLGSASGKIYDALGDTTKTELVKNMTEAVELAYEKAVPGDAILLSPGCASFDMFEDFEHRGRTFKQVVHQLEK